MASTNQSPFYQRAEKNFLEATAPEDKIRFLEEMIKECPKHKSSENMLANLRTRYKKLKSQLEKSKKSGKGSRVGIKKEDMQAIIVGFTNSGKSALLKSLTNAHPKVSGNLYTTTHPEIGILGTSGTQIQLIEVPAIDSEFFDRGIIHTADTILVLVKEMSQIKKALAQLENTTGKKIIVFNDFEGIDKRKIGATLQSKKYNFVIINTKTKEGFEELKEKLFQSFDKIRVYTKEPGKEANKKRPMILNPNSTVKDVAEKILKGFYKTVSETKIWGPSSKFPGQIVGLQHKLKDLDVVEFRTR